MGLSIDFPKGKNIGKPRKSLVYGQFCGQNSCCFAGIFCGQNLCLFCREFYNKGSALFLQYSLGQLGIAKRKEKQWDGMEKISGKEKMGDGKDATNI